MLPLDAQARKAIPIYRGFIQFFPRSIIEIAKLSAAATAQHHPEKGVFWDRAKSADELDALMRHTLDEALGEDTDADGELHATKRAWRALADLEKKLELRDTPKVWEVEGEGEPEGYRDTVTEALTPPGCPFGIPQCDCWTHTEPYESCMHPDCIQVRLMAAP